jgi:hypothetical protein
MVDDLYALILNVGQKILRLTLARNMDRRIQFKQGL